MSHRLHKTIIASCLLLSSAHVISAEDNPIAREMFDETSAMIDFELKNNNLRNIIVNVSGPRGFSKKQYFDKGAINMNDGELDDGVYNYEIVARTNNKIMLRKDRPDNGRGDKERDFVYESVTQSGHFRIADGKVVINDTDLVEDK
jgi:hypothetical protein